MSNSALTQRTDIVMGFLSEFIEAFNKHVDSRAKKGQQGKVIELNSKYVDNLCITTQCLGRPQFPYGEYSPHLTFPIHCWCQEVMFDLLLIKESFLKLMAS